MTESESFDVERFIPLLQKYIRRANPYIRQLLVSTLNYHGDHSFFVSHKMAMSIWTMSPSFVSYNVMPIRLIILLHMYAHPATLVSTIYILPCL